MRAIAHASGRWGEKGRGGSVRYGMSVVWIASRGRPILSSRRHTGSFLLSNFVEFMESTSLKETKFDDLFANSIHTVSRIKIHAIERFSSRLILPHSG